MPKLRILKPSQLKKVGTLPPIQVLDRYQPFPAHLLPPPMDDYVQDVARSICCDVAQAALPAIAIAGAAIGNTAIIEVKPGYTQPSVFWTIVVAQSGCQKSPPIRVIQRHLVELQQRSLTEYVRLSRIYQEELKDYEAARQEARTNKSIQVGEPPTPPKYARFIAQDALIEAQRRNLRDNYPRTVPIIRDELKGWFMSAARYRSNAGGQDETEWLPFFNAEPIIIDRKIGEFDSTHISIPAAHCCVSGPITPNTLRELATPKNLGSGVLARFLFAMVPRNVKVWTEDIVPPELEAAWRRMLDRLYAMEGEYRDGQWWPHVVRFTPAAKQLWVEWFGPFAQRQVAAPEAEGSALSKLEAYCLRFALLHHCVRLAYRGEQIKGTRIEADSMQAAIGLTSWFEREAFRIYDWLRAGGASTDSQQLVDYIRALGGKVSLKAMRDNLRRRFASRDMLKEALEPIIKAGYAKIVHEKAEKKTVEFVVLVDRPATELSHDEPDEEEECGEETENQTQADVHASTAQVLAQLWCNLLTRRFNGQPADAEPDVMPEFVNMLSLGFTEEELCAELQRPGRDLGERLWQFKERLKFRKFGDPRKPGSPPPRQPETEEQRIERIRREREAANAAAPSPEERESFLERLRAHGRVKGAGNQTEPASEAVS